MMTVQKRFFLAAIYIFLYSSLFAQTTWYVRAAAPAGGNGTSWASAFNDLRPALAASQKGDAVWVAEGEYIPGEGFNRGQTFALKSGVKLLGGFSGTEKTLAERTLSPARVSTLSGNIGDLADSTDNVYTILLLEYPDSSTLIEGFTFRHGYAVSDTSFDNTMATRSGAAVFVNAVNGIALPVFSHCVFRDNVAAGSGAGVFVRANNTQGSTPLFRDCQFFNNLCGRSGAAVHLNGGAAVDRGIEFLRCSFIGNKSVQFTGGVHINKTFGADVIDFEDCIGEGNEATLGGGFLYYKMEEAATPISGVRLNRCLLINNTVVSASWSKIINVSIYNTLYPNAKSIFRLEKSVIRGQSGVNSAGDISVSIGTKDNRDTIVIRNNSFEENILKGNSFISLLTRQYSGIDYSAIMIQENIFRNNAVKSTFVGLDNGLIGTDRTSVIEKNIFYKNRSTIFSFYGYVPTYPIQNNLFIENRVPGILANQYYHALFNTGNFSNKDSLIFINNLFLRNQVWNFHKDRFYPSFPALTKIYGYNNIFSENINLADSSLTLPFPVGFDSIFLASNLLDMPCAALPGTRTVCRPGNLFTEYPIFEDTTAGNYRLQPCSPGINAGLDAILQKYGIATDFTGQMRIQEGQSDMGPYESLPLPLIHSATATATCAKEAVGRVQVTLQQGCSPFNLQWAGGSSNTGVITGLAAGRHFVTLTDQKGRTDIISVLIPTSDVKIILMGDSLICPGRANGVLAATVVTDTLPLMYQWSNGAATDIIRNLPASTYTVTVSNGLGCSSTALANIQSSPPVIATATVQDASNQGKSDGKIEVAVLSGAGPFSYRWSSGETTLNLENIPPGVYDLTISDGLGCSFVYSWEVKKTSGIDIISDETKVTAAPNPARDRVFLQINPAAESVPRTVHFYNTMGQLMYARSLARGQNDVEISVADWPGGLYFWEVSSENGANAAGRVVVE